VLQIGGWRLVSRPHTPSSTIDADNRNHPVLLFRMGWENFTPAPAVGWGLSLRQEHETANRKPSNGAEQGTCGQGCPSSSAAGSRRIGPRSRPPTRADARTLYRGVLPAHKPRNSSTAGNSLRTADNTRARRGREVSPHGGQNTEGEDRSWRNSGCAVRRFIRLHRRRPCALFALKVSSRRSVAAN
jgi:hypothetical protein